MGIKNVWIVECDACEDATAYHVDIESEVAGLASELNWRQHDDRWLREECWYETSPDAMNWLEVGDE